MLRHLRFAALLLLAATLLLPSALFADDDPDDTPTVIIVGDGDERMTITLDGSALEVVQVDGDETSVHMVDLAAIGDLVGDALVDLDDLQFALHMGQDNNLQFSHEDVTWETDLDVIMAQVGAALDYGLAEFDTGEWTHDRERDATTDDLRDELRNLKAEMRDLQRELRALEGDGDR